MRQKLRLTFALLSLLLFPITMNYMSPYLALAGAALGVISGSVLVFFSLFLAAMFLGRTWCSWLCPMAGLSEACAWINAKPVNRFLLAKLRNGIFSIWLMLLLILFKWADKKPTIQPLFMTESIVSIDQPEKFMIYFLVLGVFLVLTISLGRRAACQGICWMAPFMETGMILGRRLHLPQKHVRVDQDRCTRCGTCDRVCPMSIEVTKEIITGVVSTTACILCGMCVDHCPVHALEIQYRRM
jgi:polyferredoxin